MAGGKFKIPSSRFKVRSSGSKVRGVPNFVLGTLNFQLCIFPANGKNAPFGPLVGKWLGIYNNHVIDFLHPTSALGVFGFRRSRGFGGERARLSARAIPSSGKRSGRLGRRNRRQFLLQWDPELASRRDRGRLLGHGRQPERRGHTVAFQTGDRCDAGIQGANQRFQRRVRPIRRHGCEYRHAVWNQRPSWEPLRVPSRQRDGRK